ncbi:hypothetical protein TrLO_g5378 [Triparma laevis f. longispina]|uniref:Uncharacterized protein n=1 Tax=Triparma laevis f. longispina TaxID=1714387 RepID=A0A9W7DTL2_9STRA|nr:hypothetical protein TrLO_g5378 [Triparma laevis f. longispina]
MSANEGGGEGIKHRRLGFDGNETPRSVHEDASSIAPYDIANDDWEDNAVAGGADGDGVSARRVRNKYKRIERVERDKRSYVIQACGIAGCQYKSGDTGWSYEDS